MSVDKVDWERLSDSGFLVIHEGDGRHATVCGSHKEAAEAVIQGMWHGETAEIIKEDEFASQLYSAVLNPESDQWQDMDGKQIQYDFEDGSVSVIRIPLAFPAIKAEREALVAVLEWQPIEIAPKRAKELILKVPYKSKPGYRRVIGHWASNLSGEEQPPFQGWFYDDGYGYSEISPAPTGWMRLPDDPHSPQGAKP